MAYPSESMLDWSFFSLSLDLILKLDIDSIKTVQSSSNIFKLKLNTNQDKSIQSSL